MKGREEENKWLRALRVFVNAVVLIVNIGVCLGLLASAYAHDIAPSSWPASSIVAMTFGWWFAGCVLVFAIDLIWWRRTAWIAGVAMLACLGPIRDFCPLNIPNFRMGEEEKARSFTIMTYNAYKFLDFRERGGKESLQMEYILRKRPDVVCIQEADYLAPNPENKISQRQLDSLHIVYPYVLTQGKEFAIFSKFEVKPIAINFPKDSFPSGDMSGWRLRIDDRVVNVFSVRLRSYSLTDADKGHYQDLVKLDSVGRKEIYEMRVDVFPKIKAAAVDRQKQVEYLEKYLAKYGGANAIVCGDFNDPVGCYALSSLEKVSKMRQAYAEAGFGPAITYNANYLFFRIDHILYRGNMRPWAIKRCGIDASDHYPLLATFVFDY
ncbi:MAG: endonuclease/exonuclease/phosphatase family protein [Clostridium sp.]|nr:endonuclease/exonuclease/phosphatase family protein [Clostridium sp.]